jgi:hypothetical protein
MKTATELGLSDQQYGALHSTLAALKAGKIKHLEEWEDPIETDETNLLMFNMLAWNDDIFSTKEEEYGEETHAYTDNKHCGSVCCIGGTAEYITNTTNLFEPNITNTYGRSEVAAKNRRLYYLFYPWNDQRFDVCPVDVELTLPNAIQALTNYLETGDANWPQVIEDYRNAD